MGYTFYFEWEVAFIRWLQAVIPEAVGHILILFTILGSETVIVGIVGAIYWSYNKQWGKRLGLGMALALSTGPLVKNLALRRRPYMDDPGIRCLMAPDKGPDIYNIKDMGYSMPSIHSINAVSLFGGLAGLVKRNWLRAVLVGTVLIVGLSRNYVGVHYPTDVLAGWLNGIIVLTLVPVIMAHRKSYLQVAVIAGVVTLPGWFYCTSNDFFTAYGVLWGLLLSFHFEETHPFENTTVLWKGLVRVVLGLAIFMALSEGLKLPFPRAIREAENLLAYLIRAGRYFAASFTIMGLYPLTFKRLKI